MICVLLSLELSPSLSGQCHLLLRRAGFRRRDVPGPPELPPAARGARVLIGQLFGGVPVPDVEQGGASAHLCPASGRGRGLAVPERGQAEAAGPQSWEGSAGAQCR